MGLSALNQRGEAGDLEGVSGSSLSARIERGLIEATESLIVSQGGASTPFRAQSSAASLKPGYEFASTSEETSLSAPQSSAASLKQQLELHRRAGNSLAFRAQIERGLIEAVPPSRMSQAPLSASIERGLVAKRERKRTRIAMLTQGGN